MWNLINTLIGTFLLIRDFFGYVLPGAVLFASAALSVDVQRFAGDNFALPAWLPKPDWAIAAVVLAVCYALGQLLVSAGYLILDGMSWLQHKRAERKLARNRKQIETDEERNERLKRFVTDLLYFRYRYPSLFVELDRRDTIAVFRTGLAMALIASWPLLPGLWLKLAVAAIGALMLWVSARARHHVEGYGASTKAAGIKALDAKMPPERRGVSDAKPEGAAKTDE